MANTLQWLYRATVCLGGLEGASALAPLALVVDSCKLVHCLYGSLKDCSQRSDDLKGTEVLCRLAGRRYEELFVDSTVRKLPDACFDVSHIAVAQNGMLAMSWPYILSHAIKLRRSVSLVKRRRWSPSRLSFVARAWRRSLSPSPRRVLAILSSHQSPTSKSEGPKCAFSCVPSGVLRRPRCWVL
jgi:hypothetical protein